MLTLRPFQRRAVRALESGRYDVVCLSTCRAQGKSTLAASLCMRALTPGDPLFRTGTESHLVAATISQSRRTCFKILRRMVESSPDAGAYKIAESLNVCHVRHRPSNTRVSVVAGSAKSTLGLVGCPLVVVDEPGSYELEAGAGLWDSLSTAVGKPESALQVFVIGHLAPRATAPGHWYFDLVNGGTRGRTWVHLIAGRADRWDQAGEIRRCSPLSWAFPASRAKLLEERDQARGDSRLKARFLSYRLNVPAADEATMLLTTDDWERTCARPVPPRAGRPVVGVDLGGGRSWSAAVALWRSGRVEAVAVAPGIPSVADQERRDRVAAGTYAALVGAGRLRIATGLRVQPPGALLDMIRPWAPEVVICDRFRLAELQDAAGGRFRISPRVTRWSEASEDIRAVRKYAADGPLSCEPGSRALLAASLAVATVKTDDQGGVRLVKGDTNGRSRDDVAAALTLAAGALSRAPKPAGRPRIHVVGAA